MSDDAVAYQILCRDKPFGDPMTSRARADRMCEEFNMNRETKHAGPYTVKPLGAPPVAGAPTRDAIIEECAKAAESCANHNPVSGCKPECHRVAAGEVRALKSPSTGAPS